MILPNGGVFLSNQDSKLLIDVPVILLEIEKNEEDIFILASYLKSNFFLWYIRKVLHYNDAFDYLIRRKKKLPFINNLNNKQTIYNLTHNIIVEESNYLKDIQKLNFEEKQFANRTIKHNEKCNEYMRKIDNQFLKSLNLKKNEIENIYKQINEMDIHDYKALDFFDTFFE